jgi:hypothetical protein
MAKLREISELKDWLLSISDSMEYGANKGIIDVTTRVERLAKLNTKKQFTGRRGYRKSGNLMNAIYSKYEVVKDKLLQGYIIVRAQKGKYPETRPYGRVHEFGHPAIVPRKAKHLWVKNWEGKARAFKDLTPSDFITRMDNDPDNYKIIRSKGSKIPIAMFFGKIQRAKDPRRSGKPTSKEKPKGKLSKPRRQKDSATKRKPRAPKAIPLFFLRKKVSIPERPFVRPAILATVGADGKKMWQIIRRHMQKR